VLISKQQLHIYQALLLGRHPRKYATILQRPIFVFTATFPLQAQLHKRYKRELRKRLYCFSLTTGKHFTCSSLLCTLHSQAIVVLDLHPSTHVFALVRHTRRKPFCEILIAFGLVQSIRDGQKLRAGKTVGGCALVKVTTFTLSSILFFVMFGFERKEKSKTHSLANCCRLSFVQSLAPETHASFKGTK
jgi:hypothetical protein